MEHGRHRQRRGRVRVLNYLPKLRVLDFRDARVLLAIFAGPVVAALVIWLVSIVVSAILGASVVGDRG